MCMLASPAGSPQSSCLLMDDNLHNDAQCLHAARRERDLVSSPARGLAAGPNPYLSARRQQTAKSQKVLDPELPMTTPMVLTRGGARGSLMLSTCKVTEKTAQAQHRCDACVLKCSSIFLFYGYKWSLYYSL